MLKQLFCKHNYFILPNKTRNRHDMKTHKTIRVEFIKCQKCGKLSVKKTIV